MEQEPKRAWLSIWRDLAPKGPLAMQDEATGWRIVADDSRLQQEVYRWPLPPDPFGGVVDDNVRDDLRTALLDRLDVSLPPTQRGIDILREFVVKAERAINDGHSRPLPSDSALASLATHAPSEPDPLLALAMQIRWIVRCFGDRPNVSATIR